MKTIICFSLLLLLACNQQDPVSVQSDPSSTISSDLSNFNQLAKGGNNDVVRAMTRNIYIGADVDIVLSAQDPSEIPVLAAQAFQQLIATNFPERAVSLAKEIALTKPDLIGLQEVNIIRMQSPGDAIVGGTTPAETVLMNYLDIFMATLDAFGLDYKVAGVVENADVEMPMLTGVNPLSFDDIRVTDHDVVLVRNDVQVSNLVTRNYQVNLIVPTVGIEVKRGYVALDAEVNGANYRFVNTHLEPFLASVQIAQAKELVESLADEKLPVIMVGDFNTPAPTGNTYQYLLGQDFEDTWTRNYLQDNPDGFTYGHDADLMNAEANFWERIDYIFVKHSALPVPALVDPLISIVVGDEQFNRTTSGLWPSDHGGVVARMKFQRQRPYLAVKRPQ